MGFAVERLEQGSYAFALRKEFYLLHAIRVRHLIMVLVERWIFIGRMSHDHLLFWLPI